MGRREVKVVETTAISGVQSRRNEGNRESRTICRLSKQIISKSMKCHLYVAIGLLELQLLCSCVWSLFDLERFDLEFPGTLRVGSKANTKEGMGGRCLCQEPPDCGQWRKVSVITDRVFWERNKVECIKILCNYYAFWPTITFVGIYPKEMTHTTQILCKCSLQVYCNGKNFFVLNNWSIII